jgi:hypothetical protein
LFGLGWKFLLVVLLPFGVGGAHWTLKIEGSFFVGGFIDALLSTNFICHQLKSGDKNDSNKTIQVRGLIQV